MFWIDLCVYSCLDREIKRVVKSCECGGSARGAKQPVGLIDQAVWLFPHLQDWQCDELRTLHQFLACRCRTGLVRVSKVTIADGS